MSFNKWGYVFDGTFTSPVFLQSRSGVYVIWCKNGNDWKVIDVGESAKVQDRVSNHDRSDCWKQNCTGEQRYSATYTSNLQQSGRKEIEQQIRRQTNPPCGER